MVLGKPFVACFFLSSVLGCGLVRPLVLRKTEMSSIDTKQVTREASGLLEILRIYTIKRSILNHLELRK